MNGIDKMWKPGKFSSHPASRAEVLWITWCPPGWEILPFFALIVPALLCEWGIFRGYQVLGAAGLLAWTLILWLILVAIHRAGRVRIWLSACVTLFLYLAGALMFSGLAVR